MDNKNHTLVKRLAEDLEYPNEVGKSPLVSVLVMTYNQEDSIQQCLDSILAQETNFDFEILIGEDHSSDNTRAICKSYADRYPTSIRLFEHTGEDKINLFGRPSARLNFYVNMQAARGKYIAFCEGDDHWNSREKLQKQVDAFRTDETIALCFHRVWMKQLDRVHSDEFDPTYVLFQKIKDNPRIGQLDLIELGNFIHTPSVMFRKEDVWPILLKFKEEPPALDYVVSIIATSVGRIHQIDGLHATYTSGSGVWSSQPQWLKHLKWRFVLTAIESLDCIDPEGRARLREKIEENDKNMNDCLKRWNWFEHLKHDVLIRIQSPSKSKGLFARLVLWMFDKKLLNRPH